MGKVAEVRAMTQKFEEIIKTMSITIIALQQYIDRQNEQIAELSARVDALEQR